MRGRVYSHNGCLRCRVRRKKCDEKRPVCERCRVAGFTCIWRGNDNTAIHVLPSSRALGLMYAKLRTQDETCNFSPPDSSLFNRCCPRYAISPGFIPLRSHEEHNLLVKLDGFLSMLALSKRGRDHTYEFGAGLQNLWVRDALLAFSAFVLSNRAQSLRATAYSYYSTSVAHVQRKIQTENVDKERDNLLITTLFLGLIEVNNPENLILPLLHFEAVGRFLGMISRDVVTCYDASQSVFYRVALESYLYHVSILSLFYPHTDRYSELAPGLDQRLSVEASESTENIIIALDINIYRVLFGLTVLGRKDPTHAAFSARLAALQSLIDAIAQSSNGEVYATTGNCGDIHLWRLTRAATHAVRILAMKVRDRQTLSSKDTVVREVTSAVKELRACVVQRAWKGNLVWIFTILLCAAHLTSDFEALCAKLEEVKPGLWGGDLARMQQIITAVRKKRQDSCELAASSNGIIKQAQGDTLAMLLHPKGVLAG